MKHALMVAGLAALMAGTGFVSGAMADVSTTTCGEFAQMNTADRMTYAHELLQWISNPANHAVVGPDLVAKYAFKPHDESADQTVLFASKSNGMTKDSAWTHMQMVVEIEAHCIKEDPGMMIVDRLRSHT